MDKRDEEDAWRAIVENFGERALLDDELPSAELDPETLEAPGTPQRETVDEPEPFVPGPEHTYAEAPEEQRGDPEAMSDDEGSFTPPSPPLPYVAPKRLLAWGTFALIPVVMIVAALTSRPMSGMAAALLIAVWVAAFGYLVWTMPEEPRDPFGDGAQV